MKVGVSGCLIGHECGYDGSHSRDEFVTKQLSLILQFTPYCPEAKAFGTPRQSLRLVEDETLKVITNKTKEDVTKELEETSKEFAKDIKEQNLRGFIFKAKSPSCGVERVKVYNPNGMPFSNTEGIFVKAVKKELPYFPIEDEKRLLDPWLRENFIIHLFAYDAILNLKESIKKLSDLVDFHSRFKFFLQSKDENNYRTLGKIVANQNKKDLMSIYKEYEKLFFEAIGKRSDRGKIVNVCQHIQGFIKNNISKEEKEILTITLKEFKDGIVPLIAYLKPLEIYMKKYKIDYILNQFFLNPYPKELGLRSDVKAYK
ncbi:MAG: DUF523 and DUF1722 domain-containing protein [Campylobacterales bacterium]|nr:DUF523 and DUF1722 domain-containing protein [Campylobacterales bacterium]